MIEIQNFSEAHNLYNNQRINIRLLQDLAEVLLNLTDNEAKPIANGVEINQADIDWLLHQPIAIEDYSEYLGGYVYVCEGEEDLLQIQGCDFEWAKYHDGKWPNVTDIAMSWDACNYLNEALGDPQWVIFLMCWNNAGGNVYYVPKHLWVKARVTEHIEKTNPTSNT